MAPGNIRAVVFDAVGTLIVPEPAVAVAYAMHADRFGIRVPPDEVHVRFHAAFERQDRRDAPPGGWRTSELRERQRWQAMVAEVFPDCARPDALFEALWEHFARPQSWRLAEEIVDLWRRLEAAGLKLAIASNFDARLENICRTLPPLDDAAVFHSAELGFRKPGLLFFRAVEARLAVPPGQILSVGDDLANDVTAARAAGWDAVLLDRSAVGSTRETLRSLVELPRLLAV